MSSPKTEVGSPITNRYSERYKSFLVDSPPRNNAAVTTVLRNSPLQPNRSVEHKIFEGERYSSFEIKNEDRGEWRQKMLNAEQEVEKVEVTQHDSPKRYLQETKRYSPLPRPPSEQPKEQAIEQPVKQPIEQRQEHRSPEPEVQVKASNEVKRARKVPHYMMATTSFQKKTYASSHDDINLGPRSKGGIAKRVGTSRVPRYKATTNINAIDDIRSEMTTDDTYIPMAARIKLFEKNLGNGSNKAVPHPAISASRQIKRSPSVSSRTSSSSQSSTSRSSAPNYTRKTLATKTREKMIDEAMTRSSSLPPNPSRMIFRSNSNLETKPTDTSSSQERTFKDNLNLWKNKEANANKKPNTYRGTKRKNDEAHPKR